MTTPAYKAQAIIDGEKSWPYVGNVYRNKDGSLSLLIDAGVKVHLPDGRVLEANDKGRVKIFLRAPRASA